MNSPVVMHELSHLVAQGSPEQSLTESTLMSPRPGTGQLPMPFPTHSLLTAFTVTSREGTTGSYPTQREHEGRLRRASPLWGLVSAEVALGTHVAGVRDRGQSSLPFQHRVPQLIETDAPSPPPKASGGGRAIAQSSFSSVFSIMNP